MVSQAIAGSDTQSWFVGGSIRDHILGRSVTDIDLAVAGDAKSVARAIHTALGGDIFSLSDRFGTWRVNLDEGRVQVDITALRGDSIEDDLSMRDFSINAMATQVDERSELIDLFGGRSDIEQRRIRVLGESAYADDPLRPLRLVRFAAELEFTPDANTLELTRKYSADVAKASPERVFAELKLLLGSEHAVAGLRMLDDLEILRAVLPEVVELKGVEQSSYHHLDAWEHTLEVIERTIELTAEPGMVFAERAGELRTLLDQPIGEDLSRGEGLRWAALLHDVAKRRTRVESEDGRVGFPGHDTLGAEMVREMLARLNASERFTRYVSALTRHHLRLGFLVHKQPLTRRDVYNYLSACEPVEVEVGVLSVADRMATRGRRSDEAIPAHSALAVELNDLALEWRDTSREQLVRGDELAEALGIERGPVVGKLLAAIAEEQYVGDVANRAEAIAHAQALLDAGTIEQ